MGKFLFNLFFYIYALLSAPILYLIALVIFLVACPFDKRRVMLHKFSYLWAMLYFWLSPGWCIRYSGKGHVRKGQRYIIVTNHQSMLDIALMYKIPNVFRWVSKKEVLRMPFIGWLLALHGDVLITRGNSSSARKMIESCKAWLTKGVDICLFPEGTRTNNGQVHRFKEGAFLLAKMSKVAILPVVINGTFEALPKKGIALKPKQTFYVKILPEITADEVSNTSVKEMTEKVYKLISEEHKKIAPQLY